MLVKYGVLTYPYGQAAAFVAPHWIVGMWALFATTLNVSLSWMKNRRFLSVLFGAVGGPLVFYAGFKLDAVIIPDVLTAMLVLGVGWGLLTPLLLHCTTRFDGFKR